MMNSKAKKAPRTRHRHHLSGNTKVESTEPSQAWEKLASKQKFSIEQLLNQSSIQKIQGHELGKINSRKDLLSRSPEHWIADTSKENINILIMSDPKEIDPFDNTLHEHLPLSVGDDYITKQNEDYNYKLLQLEYQKLIKPQLFNHSSSEEKDDSEFIAKMLNISHIEEKKRDQEFYLSRRESVIQQKIEDFSKIVNRLVNLKSENKILNNSINISRNSEYKQLNKNLFEINQEWDNFQGTSNAKRIAEDNGFSLRDAYNEGQIQQDLFKGSKDAHIRATKEMADAANKIKKFWLQFAKARKQKKLAVGFKPLIIDDIKVEESFNVPGRIPKKGSEPEEKQEDFNNILNQLDESSNHNPVDKSQQLSLEYKELNMTISNKPITKINSNSFCEQKHKKAQGDSIVLDHLGSISAIRSTSKFRQASEHDQSGIKQQDDRGSEYYSEIDNALTRREIWILAKSKEFKDDVWKRKELGLIIKFRQMLRHPEEICVPLTKQMATNTSSISILQKPLQRSFDLKEIKNKESFKGARTLIQRKTKPTHNRLNLIREKEKDITYIEDKKLSIILTKEQLRRLMARETITNDVDLFNGDEDISVETEQILTQLNFSENEIAPVKTRRIRYNIQLEDKSFNDSITKLL